MARFRRIKQPPIDRMGRPSEFRPHWYGLTLATIGVVVLVLGFFVKHQIADAKDLRNSETSVIQSIISPGQHSLYPAVAKPAGTAAEPDVCTT